MNFALPPKKANSHFFKNSLRMRKLLAIPLQLPSLFCLFLKDLHGFMMIGPLTFFSCNSGFSYEIQRFVNNKFWQVRVLAPITLNF